MERYFTRIFIAINILVIVGIYYLSEIVPFEYEWYENDINRLERFDAELDEAIVNTRFGITKNYQSLANAIDGSYKVIDVFKDQLIQNPNVKIDEKLKKFESVFIQKVDLTEKFKQTNPLLRNAISRFSAIMSQIIEGESHAEFIESCFDEVFRFQFIEKVNSLFRGILIYTNTQNAELREQLLTLITEIEAFPEELNRLDLALQYAKKILELQPRLIAISQALFESPILQAIAELDDAYREALDQYAENSLQYRVALYILVFLLLVILTWSFRRLQSTVNMLHIEVQRKIKAEKEFEEINRQLEQRVADRTKELTIKNNDLNKALGNLKDAQDQLIVQEKMASVGLLSTGIAHEIKNPLNFVNNFSDISVDLVLELIDELKPIEGNIDPDRMSTISDIIRDLKINSEKIKEHGVRADNIVKNMLLHSQEAGIEKEMVDLKLLMDDNIRIAIEKYLTEDKKFNVNIVKNYDPDLQKVLCAPQALARVFVYILDNALYSIQQKRKDKRDADYKPEISISMQEKNHYAVIKIRDNGLGIPKNKIDKVFDPFYTTKPTGKGNTGLGLSICYDTVVKQHKGEFRASSEEGVYAEFTIELPIGKQTKD